MRADYTMEINGGNGNATNSAAISILPASLNPTSIVAKISNGNFTLSWPVDHTGWWLQSQTNTLGTNWSWVDSIRRPSRTIGGLIPPP